MNITFSTIRLHWTLIVAIGVVPCFQLAILANANGQGDAIDASEFPIMREKSSAKIQGRPVSSATVRVRPILDPDRVRSINERIQLLSSLIEDEQKNSAMNSSANRLPDNKSPEPSRVQPPMLDLTGAEPDRDMNRRIDSTTPKVSMVGATVVTEPVNTRELGFSLYMTRNYSAAEKNFTQLLARKLPADERAWLHCLIGCCQSREKNYDAADASFRKCLNQRKAPELAEKYADWKVRYIVGRRKANKTLTEIESELTSLTMEKQDGQK